ncbi:MAG: DUF3179 domain-containing (seleno)protein [Bacteroidota bacterium]
MKKLSILLLSIILLTGCKMGDSAQESTSQAEESKPKKRKFPVAYEHGKFMEEDGRKLLYGGENPDWHFDITSSQLKDEQYHFGIGRERFHALTDPQYFSEAEADEIYEDTARFLLLKMGDEVKAYGIDLLTHHEIVNDVVNGKPVLAAYCILADLGAVYSREYGDTSLTFALSGYTYFDPEVWDGLDGFVWWDRETESTWWPLIGKGVSGDMQDMPLKVLDERMWYQTTWKDIKGKYAQLEVLKPDQSMEPPTDWPGFSAEKLAEIKAAENMDAKGPPRWGEVKE